MIAKITFKDSNGQSHTWIFKPWYAIGNKFRQGDRIRILFNHIKIGNGIFDRADDANLYVKPDANGEPVAYPLDAITGVNKPKD